ncbi:MAG: preprotein translocase subunit YajC [Christensenellales bacterium]
MYNIILAETSQTRSITMLIVMAVLLVGMMLLSIIPQKKRQKKAQEMMNSIKVGTKVKTIGGFVGIIKAIDNQSNCFVLDLSASEDGSVTVVLDKSAIYTTMTTSAEGVVEEEKPAENNVVAEDEVEAEAKLAEKKAKKAAKKKDKNQQEVAETTESVENTESAESVEVETKDEI